MVMEVYKRYLDVDDVCPVIVFRDLEKKAVASIIRQSSGWVALGDKWETGRLCKERISFKEAYKYAYDFINED